MAHSLQDFKNAIKATLHLDEQVREPAKGEDRTEYDKLKEDVKESRRNEKQMQNDGVEHEGIKLSHDGLASQADLAEARFDAKQEVKQELQSRDAMHDLDPSDMDFSTISPEMIQAMEQVNKMDKSPLSTSEMGDQQGMSNASSVGQGQGGQGAALGA